MNIQMVDLRKPGEIQGAPLCPVVKWVSVGELPNPAA